jgi:TrmH family RNA methyltransferase
MQWIIISSAKNEAVKKAALLKTPAGSRKAGCFLVEGVRSIDELMKATDFRIEAVFAEDRLMKESPGYLQSLGQALPPTAAAYCVSREVLEKISDTQTPQGVAAVVRRKSYSPDDILSGKTNPLLCLLENLQDPGNAGTILRTADSAGADGLICTRGTVDFYGTKVVRSSMGSLLHLPVARIESLSQTVKQLKDRGVKIVAAGLGGRQYHYEADLTGPCAILIGNEGAGLSEEALSLADEVVKIPMLGRAESLNAGVAAGIILYEAVRQRALQTGR